MSGARDLLARNVRKGMECLDLDSGEWLTVTDVLHITSPAKVLELTFADGTRAVMSPTGRVRVRGGAS